MGAIASQITSLTVVFSTVYLDTDPRKHQSSASLAFVRGIHRRPVISPHKWPVTRKMFPFDDVIISYIESNIHRITFVTFQVYGKHGAYDNTNQSHEAQIITWHYDMFMKGQNRHLRFSVRNNFISFEPCPYLWMIINWQQWWHIQHQSFLIFRHLWYTRTNNTCIYSFEYLQ